VRCITLHFCKLLYFCTQKELTMFSRNLIIVFGLFLFAALSVTVACQTSNRSGHDAAPYEVLSKKSFKKQLEKGEDYILVDVRTLKEYREGHIEGARNIDFLNPTEFEAGFSELDTTKAIMIYCRSGNRSRKSAAKLQEMGFRKIYDLEGGYTAWADK